MSRKKFKILIVDDNGDNRRIIATVLGRNPFFELTLAGNGFSALDAVKENPPDLILLDIMMPDMDGFQVAENLKQDDKFKNIPIIYITADTGQDSVSRAFKSGGIDYITKPFNAEELTARVNVQVKMKEYHDELMEKNRLLESKRLLLADEVDKKTKMLNDVSMALIMSLENANKLNDTDTGEHIRRVRDYSVLLSENITGDADFINNIRLYASLHDVGKVGIPDNLLKKPGKFNAEEMKAMQQHVVYGANMLTYPGIPDMAVNIARYHHEKWDGSGYIEGLKGEEIPLEARIVALADVYDALGTKRVYKEAFDEEVIDRIILEEKGKHFDPELVDIFFKEKSRFLEIKKGT